jgi:Domain of unknown function (DUF1906)
MTPIEGVDYAWSRPDPVGLYAAGKRFASRYVGLGSNPPPQWPADPGKHLTPDEARALTAAGLSIVANAEGAADGALGGWNTGVEHARSAHAMAVACGMPPDRPIYFSVDFQPTDAQLKGPVADYLLGAASELGGGTSRVGVYGSYKTIAFCAANGLARWLWQTYAWSAGQWHPAAHVQQYRNGVTLAGADSIDLDRAMVADFGQWMGDEDMDAEQARQLANLDALNSALLGGLDKVTVRLQDGTSKEFPLALVRDAAAAANAAKTAAERPYIDPVAAAAALATSPEFLPRLIDGLAAKMPAPGLTAEQVRVIVREEIDKTRLAGT